eukprot:scaffold87969_cov31-Tisochrysis_lutea.AAC.8
MRRAGAPGGMVAPRHELPLSESEGVVAAHAPRDGRPSPASSKRSGALLDCDPSGCSPPASSRVPPSSRSCAARVSDCKMRSLSEADLFGMLPTAGAVRATDMPQAVVDWHVEAELCRRGELLLEPLVAQVSSAASAKRVSAARKTSPKLAPRRASFISRGSASKGIGQSAACERVESEAIAKRFVGELEAIDRGSGQWRGREERGEGCSLAPGAGEDVVLMVKDGDEVDGHGGQGGEGGEGEGGSERKGEGEEIRLWQGKRAQGRRGKGWGKRKQGRC